MTIPYQDPGHFWDTVTAAAAPLKEAQALIRTLIVPENISGRTVLDCGCGAGDYAASFAQMGASQVVGFDLSMGSLRLAWSKSPGSGFCAASLSALPFPTESFDLLWVWGVIHYVPEPTLALNEIGRVLRPGGTVVIHTLRQGLWFRVETSAARVLSRTPHKAQRLLIGIAERLIRVVLPSSRRSHSGTTKTLQQKIHERFFVPGKLRAFSMSSLQEALGAGWETAEAHPPVSDLFKRNLSLTLVARKR